MDRELREAVFEGKVPLPTTGSVIACKTETMPYAVVDAAGEVVGDIASFLRELTVSDSPATTIRSYAYDLLRWWRLLELVDVSWEVAKRAEVELLVGWLRTARNPQRRRTPGAEPAGTVNLRTGKPTLPPGYAPTTINHALTVISGFYEFHAHSGRGPVVNPVPVASERRRMLGHRSPLEQHGIHRRAPLRQKQQDRAPRSIPDRLWDELFEQMTNSRNRALLALYVSSGARASELLRLRGEHVDWAGKRIWLIAKGARRPTPVPASPEAFRLLAIYCQQAGTPGPKEPVFRTLRGPTRQLSYTAMRRVIQHANEALGTNWSLHDLRHTAAARMAADPELTLPEVQTIMRHRNLSTTELYLQPRVEELHDKLQEHYARPRPERTFSAGYAAEDIEAVFGG